MIVMGVLFIGAAAGFLLMGRIGSPASSGTGREVTDRTGVSMQIPAHPKRVVILNPSQVDLYCAAGGAGTIVGKPTTHSFSADTEAAVRSAEEVGMIHQPNQEKILALHPDLVIGVNVPYHQQLRESLAKAGIPLYINVLDSYQDVLDTLTFFGELTGNQEQAEKSIKKLQSDHEQAVQKTQGHNSPRAVILFQTPQGSSAATRHSFAGDLMQQMGGQNLADQAGSAEAAFVPLSTEYIIRQNPEVIFIISMGNTEEQLKNFTDSLSSDPVWNGTDAVKNHRVFVLPNELFTVNPGMRMGEAMKTMAEALYPREED